MAAAAAAMAVAVAAVVIVVVEVVVVMVVVAGVVVVAAAAAAATDTAATTAAAIADGFSQTDQPTLRAETGRDNIIKQTRAIETLTWPKWKRTKRTEGTLTPRPPCHRRGEERDWGWGVTLGTSATREVAPTPARKRYSLQVVTRKRSRFRVVTLKRSSSRVVARKGYGTRQRLRRFELHPNVLGDKILAIGVRSSLQVRNHENLARGLECHLTNTCFYAHVYVTVGHTHHHVHERGTIRDGTK